MHTRLAPACAGLLLGGGLVVGMAAPALAAPCDAYSQVCPTTPPGIVGGGNEAPATGGVPGAATGGNQNPGTVTGNTSTPATGTRTLPFTGAELIVMTVIGGAALAGGTALVLAGRRRGSVTA